MGKTTDVIYVNETKKKGKKSPPKVKLFWGIFFVSKH